MKFFRILKDVLIIGGITLVLLGIGELSLRLLYPEKNIKAIATDEVAYTFHKDYLVALKPSQQKEYIRGAINGGDTIRWRSNSEGFRGPEVKKGAKPLIAVYGDSNIQARFSSLENSYVYQLKQFLSEYSADAEVVNAGIIGFGPDQSLLKLQEEMPKLKPNLIIFHVYADNDFGDLLRNALFTIDSAGNLIRTDYQRIPDARLSGKVKPKGLDKFFLTRAAKKVAKMLGRENAEADKKKAEIELLEKRCAEEYQAYQEGKYDKFSAFGDHYDFDIAIHPHSASAKLKIQLMTAILREIKCVVEANDIQLLVVIQPSGQDLTKNLVLNYDDLKAFENYDPQRLSKSVVAICESVGIDYVELYDTFMENEPNDLYFHFDERWNDHWNDEGQKVAAKAVADYLGLQKPEMIHSDLPVSNLP